MKMQAQVRLKQLQGALCERVGKRDGRLSFAAANADAILDVCVHVVPQAGKHVQLYRVAECPRLASFVESIQSFSGVHQALLDPFEVVVSFALVRREDELPCPANARL